MVYPSLTMQADWDSGQSLEAQLASKEREWKELQALRVHQLESSLKKAQEECSSLRQQYQQLKENFQFNLVILEERDRELEKYDVITARALTLEQKRQEELSQLRAQVAKLDKRRAREAEERQEELRRSQDSASQHRLQLDQLRSSLVGEIEKQKEEYERMKWDSQRRIQEMEGEMTLQREEMTAAFDSELRRREHEFKLKTDEMCAVVLSHELKVKLLSKETEVHCQTQLQATEALKAREELCQQIQSQLQLKEQEIRDLTAVKDHRIKELEDEVNRMETKLKKKDDDNIKRCEDAVQALKRCDMQREAERQAHTQQLQKAEKHIVKLQEKAQVLTAQIRHMQDEQREAVEQKEKTIQRLHTQVETTQAGWNKYMSDVSSEMVVKDTERITLQERESKLRTELERSREETEKYKQQLSAGLKREQDLEQMRVQMELEWQRRCEDMKAEHYLANEQLIQDLTHARDQTTAELKEKEHELQDLTVLLRSVKMERDQAMQGLTPKVDSLASEELRRLQEQNNTLRAVVTQMRKDMEGLIHSVPTPQAQPQTSTPQQGHHPEAPAATSTTPTAEPQIATEPPPRCKDSPAGGLLVEKRAETSALPKQEDRVALTSIMQQNAMVQQLLEENQSLRKQQLGLVQFQNVQIERNHPHVQHSRLKQAASCIVHLSRDKQQLIEMCNRLRAQITTAGLQELVEPEKDPPTEKQGEQHDRLSVLEQLQYQLTTQELQYALRQRLCTVSEANNPGPATRGTASPCSQGHMSRDEPESSRNKENTPPLSRSHSSMNLGLQPRTCVPRSLLSSEESLRSLKELWEKLDLALSPSVLSEGTGELSRREEAQSGGALVQMAVHGVSAPMHIQPQTEGQQRMNPSKPSSHSTKTSRAGAPGKISKIRNYNIKD